MDDLIARLESATEGNEELDEAIHDCVHAKALIEIGATKTAEGWRHPEYGKIAIQYYTTSIDAALSLIPDGWWAEIFARPDQPSCILWEFHMPCRRIPSKRPYVHAGKSVPLALCAAALRARQGATP